MRSRKALRNTSGRFSLPAIFGAISMENYFSEGLGMDAGSDGGTL